MTQRVSLEGFPTKMRVLRILPVLLLVPAVIPDDSSSCFCELQGKVDDCTCHVDTVDHFNNAKVYPRLSSLLLSDYFRFYHVNLYRPCPFWEDDSKCALRSCHVQSCPDEQVPFPIKASQFTPISEHSNPSYKYSKDAQSEHDCNDELGFLNTTISESTYEEFEKWKAHDDARDDSFCEPEDELAAEMAYVDLLLNPERYTGYKGPSAHRIWNSIYQENCFKPQRGFGPYLDSSNVGGKFGEGEHDNTSVLRCMPALFDDASLTQYLGFLDMCLEKRVFYRAISGMHASINIHLCAEYFTPGKSNPLGLDTSEAEKGSWGMNLTELKRRFGPESTNGEGPQWLRNLYFLFMLELRALAKAAPYLKRELYFTSEAESGNVREAVEDLLNVATSFPHHFNESTMFSSHGRNQEDWKLKEEFRMHFRNISRIMDCVGCDKCKLWGKLQVQGLGTALKILFSGESTSRMPRGPSLPVKFQLRRNEIVALFNSIGRLSTSIYELERFRQLLR